MLIANPIYDAVFKYLLEDMEIARELLSAILGEEVVSLAVKPQESAAESPGGSISIFRLDFKAVVLTAEGERKKVLIELQKAKQLFDVMRFRRYLGDNYRKEDEVATDDGGTETVPLPILTVYFLGFLLPNVPMPVLKVNRVYRDAITQDEVQVKEEFIELLTHDSFVIQIPRLKSRVRSRLERVLQVFNQDYRTEDRHKMNFSGDDSDPLVSKIVSRLNRAVATEEVRLQMDLEDEIDRIFDREVRKKLAEKEETHQQQIAEKEKRHQQEMAEKDRLIAELQKRPGDATPG